MSVKHCVDDKACLIITIWEGEVTERNFIEALKKYQTNIQCNPDYINYNEIFDISKAAEIKLTINSLLKIGRIASKTDDLFTNKKLALILHSNKAFALARMYEMYRNMGVHSSKKISVFRDRDQAIEWASRL